ncbi:MAG TPA: prepilin-type N-terminal cleavage/methylation domain-containing protein [Candidatus Paceibacterota bacterium]|jgi:prepilin-type N-terminal cleavage/methylation domain-containing protein|nr:prepilin-type N-terminal cleavage/methylation domain-containing protein [Candidatus Paceibacterota bacterium]
MHQGRSQSGFTLVELLVSIAIFTVITTVAVFNHAQFNGSVLLTNLAYEVALSIRQAQYYGISVKQNSSQTFDSGYGVDFNTAAATSYSIFEDKTGGSAKIYDGSDVVVKAYSIAKGNKISRICVDGDCTKNVVDISFIRPEPDAFITANSATSPYYGKAEICMQAPQGLKRKITVESTGQISVGTDDSGVCN